MPTAQPAKLPYCGADAANEEPLPEPSETELGAIELEAELTSLRHEVKHLRCALKAAATVLAPLSRQTQWPIGWQNPLRSLMDCQRH